MHKGETYSVSDQTCSLPPGVTLRLPSSKKRRGTKRDTFVNNRRGSPLTQHQTDQQDPKSKFDTFLPAAQQVKMYRAQRHGLTMGHDHVLVVVLIGTFYS